MSFIGTCLKQLSTCEYSCSKKKPQTYSIEITRDKLIRMTRIQPHNSILSLGTFTYSFKLSELQGVRKAIEIYQKRKYLLTVLQTIFYMLLSSNTMMIDYN